MTTKTEKLKRGRIVTRGKALTYAKCPHCGRQKPIGLWALAHLSEVLVTTCECGKKYEIGGRRA